jgi:hypothetical protein
MTDMPEILVVLGFIAILNWFAYNVGNYVGTEKACESVKMEWVKDRCMKVTREEVK